jgi:hypothetical protein
LGTIREKSLACQFMEKWKKWKKWKKFLLKSPDLGLWSLPTQKF